MSFPENFLWGAASAAAQVEGGWNEGGRTPSVWDVIPPERVRHREDPHVACDGYHRFREDVALMKRLGLKSYRFSVSWSRAFSAPDRPNPEGIRFYSELVDELMAAGIVPLLTLYHWDLPVWAGEMGGWESPAVVDAFETYAAEIARALGDRVTHWMTFNEPNIFVNNGYVTGKHFPYRCEGEETLCRVSRNVLLAHGRAVRAIRENATKKPLISMALNGSCFTPLSRSAEDLAEAEARTFYGGAGSFSWWADPAYLGKAPEPLGRYLSEEDLRVICQPLDFFGFNIYFSTNYDDEPWPSPCLYPGMPRTYNRWPVSPEVLYWLPVMLHRRYGLPLLVTENGMSNTDRIMLDGKVHDPQRTDFIKRYLACLKAAAEDGIPVIGYTYWSFQDNFEWTSGYDCRFGLVYVDYRTQERIPKDSAYEYAEIIRTNGEDLPDMKDI